MARDYNSYSKEALILHIQELEKQLKNNKYGLYWDKSIDQEDVVNKCKTNIPVLKREDELCMLDNPDAETHILIEGDNFHALTALNMMSGSEGFVDAIYIDPPYNTGNKDFKYNDCFVDKEDGYKHSKWLSFMNSRLLLAKKVLSNNGVIFISIDEHEYANLKLLCDSVFGESALVANVVWQKKTGASDAKGIATITEYILVYSKNMNTKDWSSIFSKNYQSYDVKRYKCKDEFVETRGNYYIDNLDRGGLRYSDSLNYPITCPDGKITYPNGRTEFENDGWTWKWGRDKLKWGLENGFIEFRKASKKKSGWSVCYKNYMYVDNENKPIERGAPFKNLIQGILNADGTKNLTMCLGERSTFNNPKPVDLVKTFINMVNNKNGVFLDFFAGSGTTAQAVLELNKIDGGQRKCIVCTNNEGNICTDVTYPRIKTVITGKRTDGTEYSEGIPANLIYYKTDFIEDSGDTDQAKYCLVEKVDELLCIIEDTFVSVKRSDKYSIYQSLDGSRSTFIYSDYYSEDPFKEFLNEIEKADGEKVAYVFSTDNIVDEALFAELPEVTVKPIPSKIYEIYKEIVEDIKRGEQ